MADAGSQQCGFQGNADMYGLGIRIGYYLQWYSAILAAWIAPSEAQALRITNSLFVTATFLALVILTVRHHDPAEMPVVETYIILILAFGSYLVLVPIYIWRIFTGCNPLWDPTRFPRVNPGRVYSVCNTVLLILVLVFQLWFWIHQVPKLNVDGCRGYGFFFWKFDLNSKAFVALNIVPSLFLLGICLTTVGMIVWKTVLKGRSWRQQGRYVALENVPRRRIYLLQALDSVSQAIVATVIIVGAELTIVWNQIEGVHDISSAGQTIPLFLGIGAVAMVFYVRFFQKSTEQMLTTDQMGSSPLDGGKPTIQHLSPPQASEMENLHGQYHSGAPHVHHAPVHATSWDSLPGAARGDSPSSQGVWGQAHSLGIVSSLKGYIR